MAVTMMLVASMAGAQPVRDRIERAEDRRDLRQDRQAIADDRMDAARARAMLRDYENALASRDLPRLGAIDDAFRRHVGREIAESRAESRQAHQEIRQDQAELRGDRREIRRDLGRGRRPGVVTDDVRDRNDDRRDLADDRRDARAERMSRQRLEDIQGRLGALAGHFDPRSLGEKRALYTEVVMEAEAELRRDHQELREDRRELREDRHETREDRRDRRR